MKISYLYHSGFLVELKGCYCIFDYFRGNLPQLDPEKPAFVFASHFHADHYNPEIFDRLAEQGLKHVTAVLSKDIRERLWPSEIPVIKVTFHQTYQLPCGITVQTLHSTDIGVAFLVKCGKSVIYHAGDLNDWGQSETSPDWSERDNKQMTGSYRHEIELLREWLNGECLDAAFLPLDPRQGSAYDKGILYFLQRIPVKKVYPMHYWEQPEIIQQFLQENPQYADTICF